MGPATVAQRLHAGLLNEVCAGLTRRPKLLPCKLFYDERGAALFEQICRLPEYYPTRTERSILLRHAPAMANWIGPQARIVEFGSGSGEKTRILLRALDAPSQYVPIDIARVQLLQFARDLAAEFPNLRIDPVCADYTRAVMPPADGQRTIVFFPGSTIGNFEPNDAVAFLRRAAAMAGPGSGLLIGVDLRKDRRTLEQAYNDAAGVTAAFNLNMLDHVNRVCGADFDVAGFEHHAWYNEEHGRIEMHLRSRAHQRVTVGAGSPLARAFEFQAGEHIVTEHSYKYDVSGFTTLAWSAGFRPAHVWLDNDRRFSVHAFDFAE